MCPKNPPSKTIQKENDVENLFLYGNKGDLLMVNNRRENHKHGSSTNSSANPNDANNIWDKHAHCDDKSSERHMADNSFESLRECTLMIESKVFIEKREYREDLERIRKS